MTAERTCTACSRSLIPHRTWYNADPQQRSTWSQAGFRLAKAHGLCVNCYTGARRRQALPKPPVAQVTAMVQPCGRCGLKGTSGLCSDCRDVVADLNEVAKWGCAEVAS